MGFGFFGRHGLFGSALLVLFKGYGVWGIRGVESGFGGVQSKLHSRDVGFRGFV